MIRISRTLLGRFVAALTLMLCLTSPAAAEFLDGRDLEVVNLYQGAPVPGFTVSFTVDSTAGAVEVPNWASVGFLSIDVFDTGLTTASILISQTDVRGYGPTPNLLQITTLSTNVPSILNVALGNASPVFNDPSRIAFNATTFSYDLGGLDARPGDFLRLDLTAAADLTGVPEPSSITMLSGIAATATGVCLVRRRRRAS